MSQTFELKKPRRYLYEATEEWPKQGDLNYDGYPDWDKWIAWRDNKMKQDDAAEKKAKYDLQMQKRTWWGGNRTRKSRKARKARKSKKARKSRRR